MKFFRDLYKWFYEDGNYQALRLVQIFCGIFSLGSILLFAPYLKPFFSSSGYASKELALKIYSSGGGGNSTSLFFFYDELWFVYLIYFITVISAITLTLGIKGRLSAFLTWLGWISFYNRFPSIGYGGSEVFFINLFFLIFLPNRKKFSGWPLKMIQLQIATIYIFAALTKLQGASWQQGTELLGVITSQYGIFNYSWLSDYPFIVTFSTHISTLIEVSAAILIWFEQTRRVVLFFILLLNINIFITINVTFFPWSMIAGACAFLRKDDFSDLYILFSSLKNYKIKIPAFSPKVYGFLLIGSFTLILNFFGVITFLHHQCPDGYIWINGEEKYNTKPGFCVMQFNAKASSKGAISIPNLIPWTDITWYSAKKECSNLGKGYHLISENEWMTIADQIADTPINNYNSSDNIILPTGNSSGAGSPLGAKNIDTPRIWGCNIYAPQSHRDNKYSWGFCEIKGTNNNLECRGYCGTQLINNGYYKSHLRTLVLPNKEIIWDFAGNVWQWTDAFVDTLPEANIEIKDQVSVQFSQIKDWKELSYANPKLSNLSDLNGIGMIYLNSGASLLASNDEEKKYKAFLRGGAWGSPNESGIYSLNLSYARTAQRDYIGFRCAYKSMIQ